MPRRGRWRTEKRIEGNVCRRALKDLRIPNIPLKIVLGAETGWPDRLFLLRGGKALFIEFKDPDGEGVEPKQAHMHDLLRELGYEVQVHDNEDEALRALRSAQMDTA